MSLLSTNSPPKFTQTLRALSLCKRNGNLSFPQKCFVAQRKYNGINSKNSKDEDYRHSLTHAQNFINYPCPVYNGTPRTFLRGGLNVKLAFP